MDLLTQPAHGHLAWPWRSNACFVRESQCVCAAHNTIQRFPTLKTVKDTLS